MHKWKVSPNPIIIPDGKELVLEDSAELALTHPVPVEIKRNT